MTALNDFFIRFWGVRGSTPCPGPDTARYGGNTTCMEIRCGDHVVIIDGGTGLLPLGDHLHREDPAEIDLFFTHNHFDHVGGVPFFKPAYCRKSPMRFWAGHLLPEQTLRQVLCGLMLAPLFPVPLDVFGACEYRDFRVGETIRLDGGIVLHTRPLRHPNRATGYRIEYGGRVIAVVTDTEHRIGELNETVLDLARDADIMVYDAMYTDEEYPRYVGWGHSTWQEALRIAEAANVRIPVFSHHDPRHDDQFMDGVVRAARHLNPAAIAAREGMVLHP